MGSPAQLPLILNATLHSTFCIGHSALNPHPATPRKTATEERTAGGRVLWEGRADPDVARRLARPWVGFGWIVVALAAYLFASWFLSRAERRRRFYVTDRRAWSDPPAARVAAFAPELFPPAVRRAGAGRSNVFFLPSGISVYDATRASRWNAIGFLGVSDADLPAALAALEALRRTVASAEEVKR